MNEIIVATDSSVAVKNAAELWAKAKTNADSERFLDIVRDKTNAVMDFYQVTGTAPQTASLKDVARWQDDMRERGLATSTIYARSSFLSSFYDWLLDNEQLGAALPYGNVAEQARPKAPKAYKSSQSLTDEELNAVLDVVRFEAEEEEKLTARRDWAILLFFVLTGHRREEVVRLKWKDIKRTNGTVLVRFLTKGGDYESEEVSAVCHDALVDYLTAAGRLEYMEPDTPLWTRHDAPGQATGALSSHAFAKNLKRYARDAGLDNIHVHQLRHTVARMVGEDTGDLTQVQKVLGHKNLQTTRVYLRQVSTKKDTHSAAIRSRLKL